MFDWLVVGQIVPSNPATSVLGPKHSVKKGKTPVLGADEARQLLDSIDTTPVGLRDRALIALMTYTFARVGAAVKMRVEDVFVQGRRTWARLHEKGGQLHDMPCHHMLNAYLEAYLASRAGGPKAWLFPSAPGKSGQLTDEPMHPVDVWRMIRRRTQAAGIKTRIGVIRFVRPGSPNTSATAASSKWRNKWRIMKALVRPASMIGATTRSTWMKSSAS